MVGLKPHGTLLPPAATASQLYGQPAGAATANICIYIYICIFLAWCFFHVFMVRSIAGICRSASESRHFCDFIRFPVALYFVMWWIEFACDKSFPRRPSPRRRRHVSPRDLCANEAAVAAAAAASAKWSRAFRRLQQWRTVMQAFPFRCCTRIGCRRGRGTCLADTPCGPWYTIAPSVSRNTSTRSRLR